MNSETPDGGRTITLKFEADTRKIPLHQLIPLKQLAPHVLRSPKYIQVVASIKALGLVEPLAVSKAPNGREYYLLDGLLRVHALNELNIFTAECLISIDDDTYTYNKQVSRLAPVQDHKMIVRTIERGVPEERVSATLGLSTATVRRRLQLLTGIDPEVAEKLADQHCPAITIYILKKMTPARQREAADLMLGQGNFSSPFAQALLCASKPSDILAGRNKHTRHQVTVKAMAHMEKELTELQVQVKAVESTFGTDLMQFTVIKTYVSSLLDKAEVVKWLARHRPDYLSKFQKIAEMQSLAV